MTTSAILFGAGLALLTVFFISRPFREGSTWSVAGRGGGERQQLLAQKAAIYAAIREIDADVAVGKLEQADHRLLRQRYLTEGVVILKALDALPAGDPVDAAIEEDLRLLKEGRAPEAAAGLYCPACGTRAGSIDKFCASCGARLKE